MAIDQSLLDEIQNDKENSGGSKTPTWKVPADGKEHTIRVLPGFFGKTKKRWYEPLVQHWGPSPDGRGNNIAYPCLKEHFGRNDCPFCKAWEDAKDEERKVDESLQHCSDEAERARLEKKLKKLKSSVKDLSYRRAYLHNIVDRSENTPTARAFFAPKTVWDVFVNAFTNNPDGDIFDPEDGHDFTIKRKTENNRTSYVASVKLRSSPVSDDQAEYKRIMASRVDFPKEYLSSEPSVEDMEKTVELLLSGSGKKRTFQEEDVPRRRDSDEDFRPKKKVVDDDDEDDFRPKKKKVVDDDDEDDFRPKKKKVVDDDDEDFRPKKKIIPDDDGPRPKKKVVLDDDDEEPRPKKKLVSLDDDEEPRPKKKLVSLDDDDEEEVKKAPKSAKDRLLSRFQDDDED
jgi:hypothetical protein